MRKETDYDLIIFDFHKTLTDALYFDQFDLVTRDTISKLIFRPPYHLDWDKKWMVGKIRIDDVLEHLSENLGISLFSLEESLYRGLKNTKWNQSIWDFSQSIRGKTKTAIATINTDVFSDFLVPHFALDQKFDVIINSHETGLENKSELCFMVLEELKMNLEDNRVLLIDDKAKNIDEFRDAGGEGYLYKSDEEFKEWIKS
ncbi:MAG: hypothetical protein PQJ59_07625 [Spirochaetales bacterium]|nr:hypothetical protein [Spirochaetales bacterium]